jgi:hypothetical protein
MAANSSAVSICFRGFSGTIVSPLVSRFSTAAGATEGGGNLGSKNYADGLEMSGPGGA